MKTHEKKKLYRRWIQKEQKAGNININGRFIPANEDRDKSMARDTYRGK